MEFLKNLFVDSLNGFSLSHIPLFLFQLISAALMAFVFQFIFNKKFKEKLISNSTLTAILVALLSSLVKYSLPFSILGAAILVLFLKKEDCKRKQLGQLSILIIGMGCGIGSVVQTAIGLIAFVAVFIFIPFQKD
ncbi:MAG: hypothetical protein ACI857_001278 [Arenicella sp.]|jgi:hypothetical protein